jgi:hypothetical protein
MAGIIRERQVARGDLLVVISGGAGAEHLTRLYRDDGKPVIPIWADLGTYSSDGTGGGRAIHEKALSEPTMLFRLRDGAGSEAGRLSSLRLEMASDAELLASATADLIDDLRPPMAFIVRLLDRSAPEFPVVERFFRDIGDSVVTDRGYTPREMGRDRPEKAFINVEIFDSLHRAALVVVDLTGVRPNCMMELGYALGRRRRVIISAREGTKLPFDEDKIPTYFWNDCGTVDERRGALRDWLDRYGELPPLVE